MSGENPIKRHTQDITYLLPFYKISGILFMPLVVVEGKRTGYIRFFAPVDDSRAKALLNAVDGFIKEGVERIVLLISTPGGSVFSLLSLTSKLIKSVSGHDLGCNSICFCFLFLTGVIETSKGFYILKPLSTFAMVFGLLRRRLLQRYLSF